MDRALKLTFVLAITLVVAAFAGTRAVRADDTAAKGAEDVLKEKGLTKANNLYVLEVDAKLFDSMKSFRASKKQMDDDGRKRDDMEKKLRMAKGAVGQWDLEYRNLNEKLAKVQDNFQHNQIVGQINALVSKMKEGTTFITEAEAELAKLGNSRDEYVGQLLALSEKLDAAEKQYADLAGDSAVTGALATINEKARPKMKLGPSDNFTQTLRVVRKERDAVKSDVIKVMVQGNVPHVDVNLNGKLTRSMVLDSGASYIALTADLAKSLDMVPGPADEVMHMQLADGKVVEARHMVLKSVRIGQFTVENVDCAVLPDTLVAADNLLGGSFLHHFAYKLDAAAGELHLAEIGGKDAKPAAGGGAGNATAKKPDDNKPSSAGGTGGSTGGNPLDKKPATGGNPLDTKGK